MPTLAMRLSFVERSDPPRFAVLLSRVPAPFTTRVPHVVSLCSNEQMVWIYTERHIAVVADNHRCCRPFAVMQEPRNAMRKNKTSLEPKRDVSAAACWAGP
jgi:hypothetical protein